MIRAELGRVLTRIVFRFEQMRPDFHAGGEASLCEIDLLTTDLQHGDVVQRLSMRGIY